MSGVRHHTGLPRQRRRGKGREIRLPLRLFKRLNDYAEVERDIALVVIGFGRHGNASTRL
jgi:hypothetical protein